MHLYPQNTLPPVEVKKFAVTFYIVGLFGFLIPYTRDLFIKITPLALILSAYLILAYHRKMQKKDVGIFLLIYLLGFFVEAIGVNTGVVFGQYSYGNGLGFKVLGTPLLIGVNWFFLVYTSLSISEKITSNHLLQLFATPTIMLMYDLILEQVAPKMDMWDWQNQDVPLRNYVAWWIIGLLFTVILKAAKTDTKNPLTATLFVCQFIFMGALLVGFNLIK